MANSATLITSVNHRGKVIHEYAVVLDTTSSDLTILTPVAGNHVFMHGISFSEGTGAPNLTFKSGSTTIFTPELAANQGIWNVVNRDSYYLATTQSAALILNTSVIISTLVIHVSEGAFF